VTGEENEECIFKMRAKLYRLRDEQLKERGTGNARLMRDKESKKIRFIMRQEKTLKPVANFLRKNFFSAYLCSLRSTTL
jgi:Ran-binding protein 1